MRPNASPEGNRDLSSIYNLRDELQSVSGSGTPNASSE